MRINRQEDKVISLVDRMNDRLNRRLTPKQLVEEMRKGRMTPKEAFELLFGSSKEGRRCPSPSCGGRDDRPR